jgi:Deoxynucleoside kinases
MYNIHPETRDKVWIAGIGAPGSGKSTCLKAMSEKNRKFNYVSDDAPIADGNEINRILKKIFEDRQYKFFFSFQMKMLPVRFNQVMNGPDNALVDEAIYSTLAYSKSLRDLAWMTEWEYNTFFDNYVNYNKFIPRPKSVYYFKCSVDTLSLRISRRGIQLEHNYTKSYLEALQMGFDDVVAELSKSVNVTIIDTDNNTIDQILQLYGDNLNK